MLSRQTVYVLQTISPFGKKKKKKVPAIKGLAKKNEPEVSGRGQYFKYIFYAAKVIHSAVTKIPLNGTLSI